MTPNPPTPIPIGSPHLGKPPMFDRWGLLPGRLDRREQRSYSRRRLQLDLWLIDVGSQTVVRCKTDDVSDAGLHATSPIGYGLAIGQRFEARVANTGMIQQSSPQLAPSLGYATVVRLEMHAADREPHRVGFAIRFDVPQLLPV